VECRLDPERLTVDEAADLIAGLGPRYKAAFAGVAGDRDRLRAKPDPDVWSSLEYLVHLRDSIRYHGALTNRALKEDRPEFAAPDPDAIAQNQSYNDADPDEVLDSLEQQATRFATRARSLDDDDLDRVVIRAGNEISVRYMVRNVAHEGHHHLQDVQRLLA
jgi:DinB superfamily